MNNRKRFVLTTKINNIKHYVFKLSVPGENYSRQIVRYTVDKKDAKVFSSIGMALGFADSIKNPFEYSFAPEPIEEEQVHHKSNTYTPEEAVLV